jgi:hypothetical protein
MAYCLSVALLLGRLDAADFTDNLVHSSQVQHLIRSVQHSAGSKLLTVSLNNGEKLSEPILPASDMSEWSDVASKFTQSVRRSLTDDQRLTLLDQVGHLEELDSAKSMTTSLLARSI